MTCFFINHKILFILNNNLIYYVDFKFHGRNFEISLRSFSFMALLMILNIFSIFLDNERDFLY